VAGNPTASDWTELSDSIRQWHQQRRDAAGSQIEKDANKLHKDIVKQLQGVADSETTRKKRMAAKTNVDSDTKQDQLSPEGGSSVGEKSNVRPTAGLDTYMDSIIIEDVSVGEDIAHVVKIDNPTKKDETTGMELVKIAKAIEYGTTGLAPNPAWRRSLKKMGATGVYKKSF
jgi:hypothetical protein